MKVRNKAVSGHSIAVSMLFTKCLEINKLSPGDERHAGSVFKRYLNIPAKNVTQTRTLWNTGVNLFHINLFCILHLPKSDPKCSQTTIEPESQICFTSNTSDTQHVIEMLVN